VVACCCCWWWPAAAAGGGLLVVLAEQVAWKVADATVCVRACDALRFHHTPLHPVMMPLRDDDTTNVAIQNQTP
jgi:hypothetical protein